MSSEKSPCAEISQMAPNFDHRLLGVELTKSTKSNLTSILQLKSFRLVHISSKSVKYSQSYSTLNFLFIFIYLFILFYFILFIYFFFFEKSPKPRKSKFPCFSTSHHRDTRITKFYSKKIAELRSASYRRNVDEIDQIPNLNRFCASSSFIWSMFY